MAQANVITFLTPVASMTGGQRVDASAQFITGVGTITVVLTNLEANPTSIVQTLSDLDFTLSDGTATGAVFAATGNEAVEITVGSGGTFTAGPSLTTAASIGWVLTAGGTNVNLDVLRAGGVGPKHLIIGRPSTGNLYSNADGSIAANIPNNPFLNFNATWVLDAPNVSAATRISSATLSFGTTEGENPVGGMPLTPIPEPGFLAVVALGVGVLLMAVRRKRWTASFGN